MPWIYTQKVIGLMERLIVMQKGGIRFIFIFILFITHQGLSNLFEVRTQGLDPWYGLRCSTIVVYKYSNRKHTTGFLRTTSYIVQAQAFPLFPQISIDQIYVSKVSRYEQASHWLTQFFAKNT